MGYLFISINKTAFIMYTTGEAEFFLGGGAVLKFFEGKREEWWKFLKAGRGNVNFFRCH